MELRCVRGRGSGVMPPTFRRRTVDIDPDQLDSRGLRPGEADRSRDAATVRWSVPARTACEKAAAGFDRPERLPGRGRELIGQRSRPRPSPHPDRRPARGRIPRSGSSACCAPCGRAKASVSSSDRRQHGDRIGTADTGGEDRARRPQHVRGRIAPAHHPPGRLGMNRWTNAPDVQHFEKAIEKEPNRTKLRDRQELIGIGGERDAEAPARHRRRDAVFGESAKMSDEGRDNRAEFLDVRRAAVVPRPAVGDRDRAAGAGLLKAARRRAASPQMSSTDATRNPRTASVAIGSNDAVSRHGCPLRRARDRESTATIRGCLRPLRSARGGPATRRGVEEGRSAADGRPRPRAIGLLAKTSSMPPAPPAASAAMAAIADAGMTIVDALDDGPGISAAPSIAASVAAPVDRCDNQSTLRSLRRGRRSIALRSNRRQGAPLSSVSREN